MIGKNRQQKPNQAPAVVGDTPKSQLPELGGDHVARLLRRGHHTESSMGTHADFHDAILLVSRFVRLYTSRILADDKFAHSRKQRVMKASRPNMHRQNFPGRD